MQITCWTNDPNYCDTRALARFEDGNDALDQQSAQSKATYWLDDLLTATNDFSLISALNKIRNESNLNKNPLPFPDATSMPLCIVNLVLKEYGLQIEED